jgi:hypothetical protein
VPVALAVELAACAELGEHRDHRGHLELRVHVDRDAAAVVGHGDALVIVVQRDRDLGGVAVDDLVDGVVEDLPHEVVQALLVDAADVHAGALAHVVDALEHLDRGRVVRLGGLGHRRLLRNRCPRAPAVAAAAA